MNKLKDIYYLIYNNFLAPDRMNEYGEILRLATTNGYCFYTLGEYLQAIQEHKQPRDKHIIIRHDIDTDPSGALSFAAEEAKHGIHASYYFRLKTWDQRIVNELKAQGHEIGYHYEEIATYAKEHRLRTVNAIEKSLPLIRSMFRRNLSRLRILNEIGGFASHGDFANRLLKVSNTLLLLNDELRAEQGILYEAYDPILTDAYGTHLSDKPYPIRYSPDSPQNLINRGESFLWLSHPRWWKRNPKANLLELKDRIKEGILW